jgi:energy-coupling factor transporter ATP-binding protein EcfA2
MNVQLITAPPVGLASFRLLLDEPAPQPGLQFDDYARAIGDVILHTSPQFAIGIFGDWGSGKTTLMRTIERVLTDQSAADPLHDRKKDVIPVWFNAWRYEREQHLIVPMLDTLREGLATWARDKDPADDGRGLARQAATAVGRAARALAAGLSIKASILTAEVTLEPKRILDQWQDDSSADDPKSFYHASFRIMQDAVAQFVGTSQRRIVMFIDDLDRCLPMSALEVIESMKLFFDLPGFVFVVGLDRKVVERAVELKYEGFSSTRPGDGDPMGGSTAGMNTDASRPANGIAAPRDSASGSVAGASARRSWISGTDYIKKIFQVSFSLPPVSRDDLELFFRDVVSAADLEPTQKSDLLDVVWPHLDEATGQDSGSVNPREVKRFINGYTIQMKLLAAKIGSPDPNIVLAIQNLGFRSGWLWIYDLLTADPSQFKLAVRGILADPDYDAGYYLRGRRLPSSFLGYAQGRAKTLIGDAPLDPYISSVESTTSTDSRLSEARRIVGRLQQLVNEIGTRNRPPTEAQAVSTVITQLSELHEKIQRGSSESWFANEVIRLSGVIRADLATVNAPDKIPQAPPLWVDMVRDKLDKLEENLKEMRRASGIGPSAS